MAYLENDGFLSVDGYPGINIHAYVDILYFYKLRG